MFTIIPKALIFPPTPKIIYTPITDRIILIIICRLSFSLRKNVAIMGITTGLRELIRDESDASKSHFP